MPNLGAAFPQVEYQGPRRALTPKMQLPIEPVPIRKLSKEEEVYIYNVGPWRFEEHMGSYGYYTIQALDEAKVMDDKLSVTPPLVIAGLPKEYYPMGQALPTTIYHQPPEMEGVESARPGMNFALEVCGVGRQRRPDQDLRRQGVMISTFPEQGRPKEKGDSVSWELYNKWVKQVKDARELLRQYCVRQCQDANMHYSKGTFADIRGTDGNPKIYQCARIIRGTILEYKWLGDTGDVIKSKSCLACSTPVKEDALKCPQCGTKQMSDAKYDAEVQRRQALNG